MLLGLNMSVIISQGLEDRMAGPLTQRLTWADGSWPPFLLFSSWKICWP